MITLFLATLAATGSESGSTSEPVTIGMEAGEAKLLPRLEFVLDPEPELDPEPDIDLLFLDGRGLVLVVAEALLAEDLGLCNNGGGIGRGRGDSNPESLCGWKASKKG